jgi:hypothetical protein
MATKVQVWIEESKEQVTLNEFSDDKNVSGKARERRKNMKSFGEYSEFDWTGVETSR